MPSKNLQKIPPNIFKKPPKIPLQASKNNLKTVQILVFLVRRRYQEKSDRLKKDEQT